MKTPHVRYSVTVVRSGQPRRYADTEREYLIHVERNKAAGYVNRQDEWVPDDRAFPESRAIEIAKALCQDFKVKGEPAEWWEPSLQWIRCDAEAGTIRLLIEEAYTD